MKPEAKVKKQVTSILKAHNAYYFYPVAGAIGARSGVPDIIACVQGRFIGIECKATSINKPTELQTRQLELIEQAGGVSVVINADNVVELDGLLTQLEEQCTHTQG